MERKSTKRTVNVPAFFSDSSVGIPKPTSGRIGTDVLAKLRRAVQIEPTSDPWELSDAGGSGSNSDAPTNLFLSLRAPRKALPRTMGKLGGLTAASRSSVSSPLLMRLTGNSWKLAIRSLVHALADSHQSHTCLPQCRTGSQWQLDMLLVQSFEFHQQRGYVERNSTSQETQASRHSRQQGLPNRRYTNQKALRSWQLRKARLHRSPAGK